MNGLLITELYYCTVVKKYLPSLFALFGSLNGMCDGQSWGLSSQRCLTVNKHISMLQYRQHNVTRYTTSQPTALQWWQLYSLISLNSSVSTLCHKTHHLWNGTAWNYKDLNYLDDIWQKYSKDSKLVHFWRHCIYLKTHSKSAQAEEKTVHFKTSHDLLTLALAWHLLIREVAGNSQLRNDFPQYLDWHVSTLHVHIFLDIHLIFISLWPAILCHTHSHTCSTIEPLAVAMIPYSWLITHHGWLAG